VEEREVVDTVILLHGDFVWSIDPDELRNEWIEEGEMDKDLTVVLVLANERV